MAPSPRTIAIHASLTNHHGQTALELARWFHALETASAAPAVFDITEWREKWGHPAAGRSRVIAVLEAEAAKMPAASAAASAKRDAKADKEEEEDDDEDDEESLDGGGLRGVAAKEEEE